MSDSEEDWFDKDEDDMVNSIQKKTADGPEFIKCVSDAEPIYDFANFSISKFSFKKLNSIANAEPLDAFLEVATSDFLQSFDVNTKTDTIVLYIKIFGNLSRLELPEFISDCLHVFVEDHHLINNICNLTKKIFDPKVVKERKISVDSITCDLISIFDKIVEFKLQNNNFKKLLQHISSVLGSLGGDNKFISLKDKVSRIQAQIEKPAFKETVDEMDIFPTLEDLDTEKVVCLKPNIVNGQYASVEEYLNVTMTLLREDFISPLRSAIFTLRKSHTLEESSDTKFFRNVKIMSNKVLNVPTSEMLLVDVYASLKSSCDSVTFSKLVDELKFLICGSLLVFSTTEQFNNLILAVVSNADSETINQGYIHIEIISQKNIGRICNVNLQMLACPVFFEPYRNAYRVLSTYNEDNFPMANYIVYCDAERKPPKYLSTQSSKKYSYKGNQFNPLQLETYPSAIKADMTEVQLAAFYLALSSQFSLIQGPPGTGKTEISTKLVATLLSNTTLPIIVIAYTNEALDKFLVKILAHTESIVRLGGQSKNETLSKYNIKEIFSTFQGDHRCKRLHYLTKVEYAEKFCALQKLQIEFDGTEDEYQTIIALQKELNTISRKLESLKMISTYLAVKEKRVIGMTTTCAAKYNTMFKYLNNSIVIFEEAAEILEAHIVASITQYTQQVILVGDHYQLRPLTSVYKLSREYKMNISLFERMVNNHTNIVCLDIQFRMRKEIADLIRPLIYKNLNDGPNVNEYPNIRGIEKNLFFVTHQHKENSTNTLEISKFNDFEKVWMCDVAAYLLKQKYSHSDIVMLTTYIKQKDRLHSHINRNFPELQGICVSTVDNFQGREANIVLLSLVRSNRNNQIGYLREQNRVCVALSRAKMGLYIVGNMNLLADNSNVWNEVRENLEKIHAIGDKLPITAPNDMAFESVGG